MIVKPCRIVNRLGLHARAASQLVRVAQEYGAAVHLRMGENCANAKSIMALLMLQAKQGAEVELAADGDDAEQAIAALEALIANRFGESE